MRLVAGLVAGAVLALGWQAKAAPPTAQRLVVSPDTQVRVLKVRLREQKRLTRINAQGWRQAQRELRRRWTPHVLHAIALASTIWGVPRSELVAVASCESHLYPFARNGQYRGVFQEGPMFENGPFAEFGVWDPYANVFTAALTVSRQGWRQWSCKP